MVHGFTLFALSRWNAIYRIFYNHFSCCDYYIYGKMVLSSCNFLLIFCGLKQINNRSISLFMYARFHISHILNDRNYYQGNYPIQKISVFQYPITLQSNSVQIENYECRFYFAIIGSTDEYLIEYYCTYHCTYYFRFLNITAVGLKFWCNWWRGFCAIHQKFRNREMW